MEIVIFSICLVASVIGGICGIGGGIIIKPTLDAMHLLSVSAISFLSGLTVLSMSLISVFRQRKRHLVQLRTGSLLAVGAVIGGMVGNALFQTLKSAVDNDARVGMVQAIVLGIITLATLLYTVFGRSRLRSYHVAVPAACTAIGGGLGIMSAFLGIGGGPINLAVLYFAFSMDTKTAAANSLYIIMFSQFASFATSCVKGTIPEFPWHYLIIMVIAGFSGGIIGSKVNKKLSVKATDRLFAGLLCVIVLICVYNAWRFSK